MDARAALRDAHRAVERLLAPDDPEETNPLMVPAMRRVFTQLLVQVSNDDPDDRIVSWDDVRQTVPLCVSLVPELSEVADDVATMYLDVVNHAEKLAPTYVTPPPFV
jgi:hypothetical protein